MAKNKNFKNFTYADDISIIQSLTSNRNYYPTQAVQTKQCTLSDKCLLSTRAIFLLISFRGPWHWNQETTVTKTIPSYPVKGRGGSRSKSQIFLVRTYYIWIMRNQYLFTESKCLWRQPRYDSTKLAPTRAIPWFYMENAPKNWLFKNFCSTFLGPRRSKSP